MTPDDRLSGLVESLEKSSGPDRDLDVKLYREFAYAVPGSHPSDYDKSPYYTSSIDAAMTLVPENWWLESMADQVVASNISLSLIGCQVELATHAAHGSKSVQAQASSRCLALCIAALKAKSRSPQS